MSINKDYLSDSSIDIVNNSLRVSDLSVFEFCKLVRDIVREELGRILPNYQVPMYNVPSTPGELNDNSRYYPSDHTDFDPTMFPMWNYGYKEK